MPQCSVLAPLLFVIFINDVPGALLRESSLSLFADDAKCYRSIQSVSDTLLLQSDIDTLCAWSEKLKLFFNVTKCDTMSTKRKLNAVKHNYIVNSGGLT